ncbi:hypothetical protein MXB02_15910 [Pseudomonas mosselii]|nr:hypothetical protein [Pseudomonas mosselii]ODB34878.1 hypothetical protein A9L43_26020 [Pseudomonas mosselii]UPF02078.1 hypothetical protein MXB02_15910 [Pseudomonas mosselii]
MSSVCVYLLATGLFIQGFTDLEVHLDELAPGVGIRVMPLILPIYLADLGPVGVDRALSAGRVMVPAGTVAAVEETGFLGQVHVTAAQTTLVAWKGG